MKLEPRPKANQTLRVSPKLVTSSTILQLSSEELERAINQGQIENPALEVNERRICIFCANPLYGQICTVCGHFAQLAQSAEPLITTNGARTEYEYATFEFPAFNSQQSLFDSDNYSFIEADSAESYDPLAYLTMGETLAVSLLQQLEAVISPDDVPIAEQLTGNLNERGYLEISVTEIARLVHVPLERVEYVLSQLQTLEPLGIGARDLRECLLIQLQALSEREKPHPLAIILIDRYLDRLGRGQLQEIARELKQPEHEIRQASQYIRTMLHPFPAHIYWEDTRYTRQSSGTAYIHPDVIIREGDIDFEIELIEEKRYHFNVKTDFIREFRQRPEAAITNDVMRYIHTHSDQAQFFVDCVQRRWQTLRRVMKLVVEQQREFLRKGVRYLRPLTRAQVAAQLALDEGTVSRATANKHALLPNGHLIPLSDFFDGSLAIKDLLREFIQAEAPRYRLSDEELARLLADRGFPVARRTVTKYREEMGIGSSRER